MGKLRTTLNLSIHALHGKEYEIEIEVAYSVRRGCQATYTQPGEDDTVEIESIKVLADRGTWFSAGFLGDLLQDDEDLHTMCLADWHEDQIAAEEYAAEARREQLLLDRGDC